ncbi:type II toxin-antitoxin system VapC family toxin [Pirellulales bacterium]|nr:type II toxin-antitoxin system VapC family toxin [Pirellulales bacterium]
MDPCLLDTDILSEVLRGKNQGVTDAADAYLTAHGQFTISAFTQYEVMRGFRWRKATAKLAAFEQLCKAMTVHPVTADVLDRAADLWADGATQGKPKMDADILIAATALIHGLELVTGNVSHFNWIDDLKVLSWRK